MVLVLVFGLFKENKLFDYFVVKTEFFEIFALGIERIVIMSLVLVFWLFKEKMFDYFVVKTASLGYLPLILKMLKC